MNTISNVKPEIITKMKDQLKGVDDFNQEIRFGKFHYNLPISNQDAQDYMRTSGCCGFSEVYEGIGFVMEDDFYQAAKELHRQLPQVREALQSINLTDENIEFVIGELLEIKNWLLNQKTRTL